MNADDTMSKAIRLIAVCWLLTASCVIRAQQSVDFVRDVRPILSQHCFACHGPDEQAREADLDLSVRETALAVIAPGDFRKSKLWQRIVDVEDPMPPRQAHNALGDQQVAVIREWIDAGASYAPHWAFVDPVLADFPILTGRDDWAQDVIDQFLFGQHRANGLTQADDADAATLLRRLSYDLTGLPPQLEALDAFIARPDASDAVDRLLASPHFGERMAMMWLDLVRYADTVGYHGDQGHRVWPYRDYVIAAFNRNLSFDQFTIEQLAGDLLSQPTQDQLVATTYNRLLQTSHEGGLQLGEYREIYLADRVRNVSSVWMGATVGCAQCHDHKFDPYTSRDFYSLGAFFADVDDEEHLRNPYGGLNSDPTRRVPEMRVVLPAADQRIVQIDTAITKAEAELDEATAGLPRRRAAWLNDRRAGLDNPQVTEQTWIDDEIETGGSLSGDWTFGRNDAVTPHSGKAYRTQFSRALVQHYSVDTTQQKIHVQQGHTFFAWVYLEPENPTRALMLQFHQAGGGWEQRAVWGSDEISYGRKAQSWKGYLKLGDLPRKGAWVSLEVELDQFGFGLGDVIDGVAFTQFGGTVHWDRSGHRVSSMPRALAKALSVGSPSATDLQTIAAFHRATDEDVQAVERRLSDLRLEREQLLASQPMTMYTRALASPREVRVRPRGNWLDNSGEVVSPAIPSFFGTLETDGRATRLDLARWLVDRDGHGLRTSRVFVNRIWAMLFGVGLCPSTEDFGGQGRPPNHPELLDYLALHFVDSGWDVKALIKKIVLSHAYRMSSSGSPEALAADPFNEWFARQSRHRWPAEMIRDTALSLAGLLVTEVGGPSVKPQQPRGYFRHLNFPMRKYRADDDGRKWRRGVYVHWQRQFLHPMLRAFDAPTREECVTARPVSNTPTAALTLLNDPVFVEASRMFAQQTLGSAGGDEERLIRAFRRATARVPRADELAVLTTFLHGARDHFQKNPTAAKQLLQVGSAGRDDRIDVVEHAAWTELARTILNLHETITRG